MTDKTRGKFICYLVVIMLVGSTMAGVPDTLKWFKSDSGRWFLNKKTTTTVHSFWLRVKEGNSIVDENIKIDTQKETEIFHVYPYDTVDEAIFLSDFKKNLTLIKLPKKNQCLLQNLNPITPPPRQLIDNIKKAIALNGTNKTIDISIKEKSSWKIKNTVLDRSQLSQDMKQLCLTSPIYKIWRTAGQVYVKGLKRQGRSPVRQRSACGSLVCHHYYKWYCTGIVNGKCVWVKLKVYDCQKVVC
ncbi:uncharacterized protein LOC110234039 isoform X2 [Exaiptasia diaphana]|uniref:BRICHOS domain-containing protein n=1 Tax=Exaiptasia diaphana TaxID=2652724 RepID=A0A913WWB8_EXADI|nr:uncharacterized protein LOC110234039 isoform X2 [Exaiptasia diaphana]KXJ17445.1 hypothetical protein AC249_AIPGENE4771 [Exaiptasia diaphana]